MSEIYVSRYDRHCLDKLLGSTTEERLIEEGHVFKLTDGTEYNAGTPAQVSTRTLTVQTTEAPPPPPPPEEEEEQTL